MKNGRPCPKCSSSDVVRVPGEIGVYGHGNNIPVGIASRIPVTRYVCSECGFCEEWVEDPLGIRQIARKYEADSGE